MKKGFRILIFTLLITVLALTFASCKDKDDGRVVTLRFSGDIEGFVKDVDIYGFHSGSVEFTYEKDGESITERGFTLDKVLENINCLAESNYLLVTGDDSTSAKFDMSTAHLVYVQIRDDGSVDFRAPSHPPVVSIKNIQEITVICKDENIADGMKLVKTSGRETLSFGSIKLKFFEQRGEVAKFEYKAYKYVQSAASVKLSSVTGESQNIVYFADFDIKKEGSDGVLIWENGRLKYKDSKKTGEVFGVVTGTDTLIYDAFFTMKDAIDANKKVMFILPDGLSMQQIEYFADKNIDLGLFSEGYRLAASVNPAISNVALATIITGGSPFETGTYERNIRKPDMPDIFDYVLAKNKSAVYIEGNGNLLLTNIEQKLNAAQNGYTDFPVYATAKSTLQSGTPDLLFVHFHGIDDVNHEYSPLTDNAKNKILEVEGYIADLIERFDGDMIIIVPDHGHITYQEDGEDKGKHGVFEKNDMYVPFYVIEK